MTIRKLERQSYIAWMAVLAILLLSIVPTISQIVAGHAPHVHASMTAAEHAHRMGHAPASGHDQGRDRDDDCWRKCGYCEGHHRSCNKFRRKSCRSFCHLRYNRLPFVLFRFVIDSGSTSQNGHKQTAPHRCSGPH
jgi:hypothetical protein